MNPLRLVNWGKLNLILSVIMWVIVAGLTLFVLFHLFPGHPVHMHFRPAH